MQQYPLVGCIIIANNRLCLVESALTDSTTNCLYLQVGETALVNVTYVSSSGEVFFQNPDNVRLTRLENEHLAKVKHDEHF